MPIEPRRPEGREVGRAAVKVFSRVAGLTGPAAAWRVRRILGEALRPGVRILDIGTGPGTIPLYLKRFCRDAVLTGLDVSWEMLREARGHSLRMGQGMGLVRGDAGALPVASGVVDVVLSLFTLHHIDRPAIFLKEVDRVLRPGGRLLLIDFRRDMPRWRFRLMDGLWQLVFCKSPARTGFRDSVRSAWLPVEIEGAIEESGLGRFRVAASRTELWVVTEVR
jgi:ubiquinone/menaquinone biosynthesis C-methylase UbiE